MADNYFVTEDLLTVPFRISYPNLFTPVPRSKDTPDKLLYSATAIFSATDHGLVELRRLAKRAIEGLWTSDKAKWPPLLAALDLKNYLSLTGKDGWPLRDGASQKGAGYGPGTVSVKMTANVDFKPLVVDQHTHDVLDKTKLQSGMICRAVVQACAYRLPSSSGVKFSLRVVQIVKDDGVRFGGGGDNSAARALLTPVETGEDDPNNYGEDL